MLTRCRKFGITLNKDKFVVGTSSGFWISKDGISMDPNKVAEIKDFPTLTNLTDLHSFMGLVNQLANFTTETAYAAQSLKPLMSPKDAIVRTTDQDGAFCQVKTALASPSVLAFFDTALPVTLQTNAS